MKPFDIAETYRKIKGFKTVSFDIFDTLIKRNVSRPSRIFAVVEEKYNNSYLDPAIDGYERIRISAERSAREKCAAEEIAFEQIFSELPFEKDICDKLKELEIEAELQYCLPNYPVRVLFERCVEEGRSVVLISDMYLPQEIIEQMLVKCGYKGYRKLYLSSVYKQKKSTGGLYDCALQDLHINPKDIVHIGDSKKSDVIMPLKKGIKSIYIGKRQIHTSFLTEKDIFGTDADLYPFINNKLPLYMEKTETFRWGYEALGPLLLGFCTWVHQQITENKIEKAYFLARDMDLIIDIYHNLYGQKGTAYLEVSRLSLRDAYIKKLNDLTRIFETMPVRNYTALQLLHALCLDENQIETNIDLDQKVSREILALPAFADFRSAVMAALDKKEDGVVEYLSQEGLFSAENVAVIDIGWFGTIQRMLEEILGKKIKGFYFGNTVMDDRRSRAKGYWIDGDLERRASPEFSLVIILEVMIAQQIGTTVGYCKRDGKYCPQHADFGVRDTTAIREFQAGAIAFVKDYRTFRPDLEGVDMAHAVKAYQNLAYTPTQRQAMAFSGVAVDDDGIPRYNTATAKPIGKYLISPKLFFRDVQNAKWREGFIAQIMPFIKNPHKIVELDYRIRKKQIRKTVTERFADI